MKLPGLSSDKPVDQVDSGLADASSNHFTPGKEQDWHELSENTSMEQLAVTLASMANISGGKVLIRIGGVSKNTATQRRESAVMDRVFQAALFVEPPLILPLPRFSSHGNDRVLTIHIPTGLPNLYSVDGRYWGWERGQTVPIPARHLRRLLIERGIIPFENQVPPEANIDDLDPSHVSVYIRALNEVEGIFPEFSLDYSVENSDGQMIPPAYQQILLQRGCLKRVGGKLLPTYAALLMFGKSPQQWLPNTTILAARFSGTSMADQFIKQEIRGPLPQQLRMAEVFLKQHIRSVVRMNGFVHAEQLEYPFEAVREVLVNAVAHRDYNLQGDTIHLHLFSDRLEVQSPGVLPGPVTLSNLLNSRFARNAVITQLLADLGFVERLGYGLDRVVTAMAQHGLPEPHFEETAGRFMVTLYNNLEINQGLTTTLMQPYMQMGLNSRQLNAIRYILRTKRITNREFQDLCPHVHMETLRRDLADLTSKGLVIKVGDKKATYYIMKWLPDQEAG